jgi:hypothetical protein
VPYVPQGFFGTHLPYDFDPEASCERWEFAVANDCPEGVERVGATQEWFGLLFASLAARRPAMALPGEGSSLADRCRYYEFKSKLLLLAAEDYSGVTLSAAEAVLCPFDALTDISPDDYSSPPPGWIDEEDPAWWFVVGEVSGILNWSLDGLARLLARRLAQGKFTKATWFDRDFVARRKKYMAGRGRRILSHILDQGRP